MLKLSKEQFNKAREFIYRNARPLDLARWEYHFENGSKENVLKTLSYYQNENGGFGHALEPDIWNPNSSPVQTLIATNILNEINFYDNSHNLIKDILHYLASGSDFDGHLWHSTLRSNNNYPHAPWWHVGPDAYNDYNPTIALAGFSIACSTDGSSINEMCKKIIKEAYDDYLNRDMLDNIMTVQCYINMVNHLKRIKNSDIINIDKIESKLKKQVKYSITEDTKEWETGYVCKPSTFFNSPNSIFYKDNKLLADYECDFIIKTQCEDGAWDISWSWNDYPNEYAISKNWWKSDGIILNLLYLKNFDRIL